MPKNLFDYCDEEIKQKISQENFEKIDEKTSDEAKNLYEKYKNYSQQDLISEFLKTSKEKLKTGELSQEKISKTIEAVSPYLNNEQKNFLKGLIDKLND